MSKAIRYCEDCVFFSHVFPCAAPANHEAPRAPVTRGVEGVVRFHTYRQLREDGWINAVLNRTCGRSGRWWKPKEGK